MAFASETFLQIFRAELAKRALTAAPAVSEERWAYRESAAVLTFFEPGKLRPLHAIPLAEDVNSILCEDMAPAPGLPANWFLLKPSVRREALERLGSFVEWQQALTANPDRSTDPFQRSYEIWLSGTPKNLDEQSYEELQWSTQIASWLDGLATNLPKADYVRTVCQRRSVYALFSHLASSSFTGREKELATLRDFVGVLPASTVGERLIRQFSNWLSLTRRDPIALAGKGGVGKSALLARLLNEHLTVEEPLRFPFAYLAFDSPTLRVEEPFTLLTESTRQLQLLQPERIEAFTAYQAATELYRDQRGELEEKSSLASTRGVRQDSLQSTEESLYAAFANLINDLCDPRLNNTPNTATRPFLLVLDTFEEATYRGNERLIGLYRMLENLHRLCPTLRLLISTRPPFAAPPDVNLTFTRVELSDLTATESELLLQRLELADPAVIKKVARQIGGNPLNLQLAARVLKYESAGSKGIEGIQKKKYRLFSVATEVVRGQLYARLLDHIHDPRVRSLAHPGMVLRKIDPPLIQQVLSGPCKVEVQSVADAEQLCDALAQEHTLVYQDAPRSLRYRPDIRLPVLKLLGEERPKQVREIHMGAIEYFLARSSPSEQAEALYHRLALETESSELEPYWRPEYGQYLGSAMEELPPRSQRWLASKLGLNLSSDMLKVASQAEWEAITGRKVRDTLRYGLPEQALALLKERPQRATQSPLFAYEAKALIAVNRLQEARAILEKGVASMEEDPSPGRLAELYWLLSQVSEALGDRSQADTWLAQAESITSRIPDSLAQLQVLLQRLLLRRQEEISGEPLQPIRQRLAERLLSMSIEDWHRERSLSRTAAMLLGPGYPDAFIKVISQVGFGTLVNTTLEVLIGAVANVEVTSTGEPMQSIPPIRAAAAAEPDLEAILREAWQRKPDLDGVFQEFSSRKMLPELMPVLNRLLPTVPFSLGGSNLAGIEDYREAWENEIALESV